MSDLLSYRLVRTLTRTRPGTVPPVAIVLTVDPDLDPADPASLLRPGVQVTAVAHPTLDTLLRRAGAQASHGSYTLKVPATGTPDPAVLAALAAVHPTCWRTPRGRTVSDVLGPAVTATLPGAGTPAGAAGGKRPRRLAGLSCLVTRTGTRLKITPVTDGVTLAGHPLHRGPRGRLHLTPDEAVAVTAAARARGLVVLDGDQPSRWTDLVDLVARALVLRPVPGAPGWAQFHTGHTVTSPSTRPLPAADAVALARTHATGAALAIDPAVTQAAAVTATRELPVPSASTGAPTRVPTGDTTPDGATLHPWQERLVEAYLASGPGLVNALPPGSGKTVCAAAAMAARASTGVGPYRAVVLAPAAVRDQWAAELAAFFPTADTQVVTAIEGLAGARDQWADGPGARVLVCTPQLLTRTRDPLLLPSSDLVVDEAVFLANPDSRQARAAWLLRDHADHAMVLTGTPDQRGSDGTGALVAFARGNRSLFTTHPLSRPHPSVPGDRVGGFVVTGGTQVTSQLPAADLDVTVCTPGVWEQTIDELAAARVRALLATRGRPSAPRLRTELEAWRLGLTSPAALLGSRYALGAAASAALSPTLAALEVPGVKVGWVRDRVAAVTAAGGQVLVFSDFTAALDDLDAHLAQAGVTSRVLSSALTPAKRAALVADFTAGAVPVLLVSAAGQLGVNLQAAATVVHLDVPTSAAILTQRAARAARLGSRHEQVAVHTPVLSGCGDQRLLAHLAGAATVDTVTLARVLTTPAAPATSAA